MEQETIKVAFYGSLRKGHYNYERFKDIYGDGFNYVRTTSIVGYKLYDLGAYPGLKPSNNDTDRVIVDIIECSPKCFNHIEAMEHGAGYITARVKEENSTDNEKYHVYIYEYPVEEGRLVVSGDWSKQEEIVS